MKYSQSLVAVLLTFSQSLFAQTEISDTTKINLQPVEIKQYFNKQSILQITSSAHSLSSNVINAQSPVTLISGLNTVAGIRMEERSPGSYRLAMRGSLIRSPFGIRNTKIYIDEFPFTDAGGNTYLNLLDPQSIASIHVIKGPDGSIFGANSGGVIRINPKGFSNEKEEITLQLIGGAFGLFNQNLGIHKKVNDKYNFAFNQSYLTSDGYRENSAFDRKTLQTVQQLQYNSNASLKLFALYTDLNYQTPGGLTLAQYETNPKSARPAAGPNPGAIEQKAAIYNKTLYGGVGHEFNLSSKLSHYAGIFGSYTDFENPFITNYEFRIEKNLGLRTFISYNESEVKFPFQFQIGLETSKGWNTIDNYDNNKGIKGDSQANDLLDNHQLNIFSRAQVNLTKNWMLEASLGLNKNTIKYESLLSIDIKEKGSIKFDDVWMPRIGSSYLINDIMAVRGSISKGYSTPTLAEVRSSDNTINKDLLAESGINYELGYKINNLKKNWLVDLAYYQYKMNNGIVRRLNDDGIEFYSNAGEINQKGLELSFWSQWQLNNSWLKSIQFNTAMACNHYRFGTYSNANNDYSTNKLTSVPNWTLANSLNLLFAKEFQLNIYHNHTGAIPLDDANTTFADSYDLLQAKLNWTNSFNTILSSYTLFVGMDNILNQKYSLGNDINAFGGRYFNAAPTQNVYAGIKLSLKNN